MLEERPALRRESSSITASASIESRAEIHDQNARTAEAGAAGYDRMAEVSAKMAAGLRVAGAMTPHPVGKVILNGTSTALAAGAVASAVLAKNLREKAAAEKEKAEKARQEAAKAEAERQARETAERQARETAAAKERAEKREWDAWRDRESRMGAREKQQRTDRILEGARRANIA